MVEEFEIADKLMFITVLLFSGFLFFPCCPSHPKTKNLKPAVSATNVQSAHSANKWKNKKTFLLLSSFFLAAKFKKKKRPNSLVFIVPK